jgi:cytochrome b6-f complex iron-sulfur subunit
MKRREFVNWVGVGAIATSLPVAIVACSPKSDTASEPADEYGNSAPSAASEPAASDSAGGDSAGGFTAVGTTADLDQQGYLTNSNALSEPVIVIKDPNNPAALIALASKCTHQGCEVAWQEDLFACPCHGSKFNPDGSVVNGPATEPLAPYTAKIEGDSVLVAPVS